LFGKIRASLQSAAVKDADLDLGCMISFSDSGTAVVQALGNSFGAVDKPPYVHLDADDRTGGLATGENLAINLDHQEASRSCCSSSTSTRGPETSAAWTRR
jgi:uncharacterized protein involved in tellurium resistance